MTRDLPLHIPNIVRGDVENALNDFNRADGNRSVAASAYREQMEFRFRQEESRDNDMSAQADALFDFGVMLREQLPTARLREALKSVKRTGISIVSHQIDLKGAGPAPAGTLKVDLELEILEEDLLFRQHAWFDGYRVVGGAGLGSATSIRMSIHPEMLRQIHGVVSEGVDVWRRITFEIQQLPKALKDR